MKSWKIIYGSYGGVQKEALKRLYATVSEYDIKLSCVSAEKATKSDLEDFNVIFLGTESDNAYLKDCSAPDQPEGYRIKVEKSKYNAENSAVYICGADDNGVLYGCVDFAGRYLVHAKNNHNHADYFKKLMTDVMPETDFSSSPSVSDRGLWTWGYVIYDYKKYIDHMVDLKLNTLTVWNDFLPVNAKEIVDYAHSVGVKIIWGFSWLWDVDCDAIDITNLDKYVDDIVDKYENEYAHIGGDGIYFQSFTETNSENNGNLVIAQAVTRFVNNVSEKLYKKYPDLNLQFGLHANSVKNKLEYLKELNPKITTVWENCGAFPFDPIPKNIDTAAETAEFTEKIMSMNTAAGKFGVVLKGLTHLDWNEFYHQEGEFVLGEATENFVCKRTAEKQEVWRYLQAYWIRNADAVLEEVRHMTNERNGKLIVSALAEDGMFEKNIWYPMAMFAEMLWNADKDIKDIMCDTALMPNVVFAQ